MAAEALKPGILPTELHTLPIENLIEIASYLTIPVLRVLSKVNRRLCYFVEDYFQRYRYKAPIWAIPNEILFEVVQYLDCQKDRSRLAQSCRKFYPIITDYISQHNVRHNKSSLLNYAAKRDLRGMTRRILRVGGDLETRLTISWTASDTRRTPLVTAARHGHLEIIKILLKAGASQFVDGLRIPLAVAMLAGHEAVALLLSRQVHMFDTPFGKSGVTVLQIASEAKLPRLVKHYLTNRDSHPQQLLDDKHVRNLSNALVRVLWVDVSQEELLKRKLDKDAYKIVLMLLRRGASPDIRIGSHSSPVVTARVIASRHPDPRIRNLLSAGMPMTKVVNIRPLIGRLWTPSEEDQALMTRASQSHVLPAIGSSSSGLLRPVTILNFSTTSSLDGNRSVWRRRSCEEILLNASDIAEVVQRENCKLKRISDLQPLELTIDESFPQLACPKTDTQSAAKEFWARTRVRDRSRADSRPTRHTGTAGSERRAVKPREKSSNAEPFPQLTPIRPNPTDVSKDTWASFMKGEDSQHTKISHSAPLHEEVHQETRQLHMSRKQKKWVPMAF